MKLILLFLSSLVSILSQQPHEEKYVESRNELSTYEQIWRSDSCGCYGKRTVEMGSKIIKAYNLQDKTIDSIFKYMGRCNMACIEYVLSPTEDTMVNKDENYVLVLYFDQYGLVRYEVEQR